MKSLEKHIREALQARKEKGALRSLAPQNELRDFCSNDYLGLARSPMLKQQVQEAVNTTAVPHSGATGSRLISGNSSYYEQVEQAVAYFHKAACGLIYNSGYDANIGVLPVLARRGDTILYDQLIHASLRDGIRLSHARSFAFRHNDLNDLKAKLQQSGGTIYIVVESVYSMDGDQAPLEELLALCRSFKAQLIVDEAHATGIYGHKGEGLCVAQGIEKEVLIRIHTFGKAIGGHGAIVLCNPLIRDYLINYSRSFIYTTALPHHSLVHIEKAYEHLNTNAEAQQAVLENIRYFKQVLPPSLQQHFIASDSPIQCMIVPGNEGVKRISKALADKGYDIRPILHPTVPEGSERLRICLHGFNSKESIKGMLQCLEKEYKTIEAQG